MKSLHLFALVSLFFIAAFVLTTKLLHDHLPQLSKGARSVNKPVPTNSVDRLQELVSTARLKNPRHSFAKPTTTTTTTTTTTMRKEETYNQFLNQNTNDSNIEDEDGVNEEEIAFRKMFRITNDDNVDALPSSSSPSSSSPTTTTTTTTTTTSSSSSSSLHHNELFIPEDDEMGLGGKGGRGKGAFRKYSVAQMERRMDAALASGNITVHYIKNDHHNNAKINESAPLIAGLVAVRNVARNIGLFLQLLARYTDVLVVLDDASDDGTADAVRKVANDFNVRILITKSAWVRNEAQDKNLMLRFGRRIGATHFIVPDYDETFSAPCAKDDYLRRQILALEPGGRLQLHWREYWDGLEQQRVDPQQPSLNFLNRFIPIIFRDSLNQSSDVAYVVEKEQRLKIHYPRIPLTHGAVVVAKHRDCVILEFRFVSVTNVFVKRIWYAMLGKIHGQTRKALGRMNRLLDEEPMLKEADVTWLDAELRRFASSFSLVETWRLWNIIEWIEEYGREYFEDIPMWQVDWKEVARRLRRVVASGSGSGNGNGDLGVRASDIFDANIQWRQLQTDFVDQI